MSLLKVVYWVLLVFLICVLKVPKIEICLKYFLDKNPTKQPLCLFRTLRVPQCFDEFFDSKNL